eukprot:CAMPEP_0114658272 /NCGR_PEP_ID=MMETSP0191-20121206/15429_1 /TAXON_ID=126664 /ORGANISM="Sorites sp." /LENGTH=155 /DNA_ID=CAMNT_0001879823 /DNA_START=456 /DNA_END=923 /DNA_ORIENTATION=+
MNEAKQTVGIFSTYGVMDAKRLFWSAWEWGKDFAKRMSWYDAMFMAFGHSRDEGFWVYIAKIALRTLMNFTVGFIYALIWFVWKLFWFVREYGGGITGLIFFILGSIAAFSMIVTTIMGMYAGAAGIVATGVTIAKQQAIQGGRQPNRYVRQHYD